MALLRMINVLSHSSQSISSNPSISSKETGCQERASKGFSVLEALVAIAVLAAAFLPLLWTHSQFVKAAESYERTEKRLTARQNALAYLRTQNFVRVETGTERQGHITLRWVAEPMVAPRMSRDLLGQPGRYQMTLYTVDAVLESDAGVVDKFTMQGLGWEPLYPILQGGL